MATSIEAIISVAIVMWLTVPPGKTGAGPSRTWRISNQRT
jgi:hypothetical protein